MLVSHYDFSRSWMFDDVCQNVRQDVDIYWNLDHQKAKKLKKKQTKKNKTHKQTGEPTNKQMNKQRNEKNKQPNKQCRLFFCWSDAMAGAIACGQTKQMKRQQTNNHANRHTLMNLDTRTNKRVNK